MLKLIKISKSLFPIPKVFVLRHCAPIIIIITIIIIIIFKMTIKD